MIDFTELNDNKDRADRSLEAAAAYLVRAQSELGEILRNSLTAGMDAATCEQRLASLVDAELLLEYGLSACASFVREAHEAHTAALRSLRAQA